MIKFLIKTFGCQANVADSESLARFLQDLGVKVVESEQEADLIIINTCAIRELAEQKLFSYIGRLAKLKRQKAYLKIGVIGCVASYRKSEIYSRFDHVNFVYSAREEMPILKAYLADFVTNFKTAKGQDRDIQKIVRNKKLLISPIFLDKAQKINTLVAKPKELIRSMVNIMTGCNKFCSYCIVPFTRGRETSFASSLILKQIKRDIAEGATEITLLGQNVNSYIDPEFGMRFPELLKQVAEIEGNFWVRYVSPHPQDMTKELFEVMAQCKDKLCSYVHFPVQSGSNRILKLMNRNYTSEEYLEKIGWLKKLIPNATISTDIIVGFPGETEEDYQETIKLLDTVKLIFSIRLFIRAESIRRLLV
jgi:tRNA-2-methylthio-N6-dimethylallyladenosine synthase